MSGVISLDMRIGLRIGELRRSKGMSYAQFAEETGRTRALVCLVERGKKHATPDLLRRIIRAYCVNEEWLLNGTGEVYNEAALKKKELYNVAYGALEKVMKSCKLLEETLFFNRRYGDEKMEAFSFYKYFDGLNEEKIRSSPVEPLELVRAFLTYYMKMESLLAQALQILGYLKSFDIEIGNRLEALEKSLQDTEKKFHENYEHFREFIKEHDTSSKVIGIMDDILSLCKPLDYKQQIDIKRVIADALSK